MAYDGWPVLPEGTGPEDYETAGLYAEWLFPQGVTPELISRFYENIIGRDATDLASRASEAVARACEDMAERGRRYDDDSTAAPGTITGTGWAIAMNGDLHAGPAGMTIAAHGDAIGVIFPPGERHDILGRIDDTLEAWEHEAGRWLPVDDPEAHAESWLQGELAGLRAEADSADDDLGDALRYGTYSVQFFRNFRNVFPVSPGIARTAARLRADGHAYHRRQKARRRRNRNA